MPRRATSGIVRTWLPPAGTPFKNLSNALMSATGSAIPVFGGLLIGAAMESNTADARARTVLLIEVMGESSKRQLVTPEFAPLKPDSEVRETFRGGCTTP